MPYVIVNLGILGTSDVSQGRYLKDYDPDWTPPGGGPMEMTGRAWWTDDKAEAKLFPDATAAFREWQRQSVKLPLRPWDGKPNRPLTAYSITVEPA